jgi:hypothetical protein
MTDENKRIIEIEGVKLEVDLRQAKRVDTLRVGDPVKVWAKSTFGNEVRPGVVVGFEPFKELPTIIVACINVKYNEVEMKFVYFNSDSKDMDIIASVDPESLTIEKAEVLAKFDREIASYEEKAKDVTRKKQYFLDMFGKYFPAMEDVG